MQRNLGSLVIAFAWSLVIALAASALAAADPRPLSLDEAVALARRHAPGIVQAEGQRRTAAASVRAAYAAFAPSLGLSADLSRPTSSAPGSPSGPWSSSFGLAANVALFDGGARIFDLRAAQAQDDVATAGTVAAEYAAALGAKQRWFDVLAARESQAAAAAQLAEAEQQRRMAVARAKARTATRSDSLRAEIEVRNAALAVSDAAVALATAEAGLARAVGSETPVTASTVEALPPATLGADANDLASLAASGPAVRQALAALDAAKQTLRGAWTDYLPTVSASYSGGTSGAGASFGLGDEALAGAVRLSLSLPIFDRLQREARNTQARAGQANAEAAVRDARLAAAEQLTRVLGAHRTATEREASYAATLTAAEEDLRVQRQRYAAGSSTLLEVLASQTQINQARSQLIRARYDQRVAKAQIEALVGKEL